MRTHLVNFDTLKPLEIGASLFALLAFPEPDEEQALHDAASAWVADMITVAINADPSSAEAYRAAYPQYVSISIWARKKALRTAKRRLRDRMVAARMARAFFQEALTDQPAVLPPIMLRNSLNELSKLVLRESGRANRIMSKSGFGGRAAR